MKPIVFLSYSHEDKKKAEEIFNFLQHARVHCWIDKKNLRFSEGFEEKIFKAIRSCCLVIWVASKSSVQSDYVRKEINYACQHKKPVGPIFLEHLSKQGLEPPFNLNTMHSHGIDYFENSAAENLGKLIHDLRPILFRCRLVNFAKLSMVFIGILVTGFILYKDISTRYDPIEDPAPSKTTFSIPPELNGTPAGEVFRIAYQGNPPAPSQTFVSPRFQFEILALRHQDSQFKRLEDGDSLRSEVDQYVLLFNALTPGYLYIFQVDASGQINWLFPKNRSSALSYGRNPVRERQLIQLPPADSNQAFFLDSTVGIEHVYVVFSVTEWTELTKALTQSAFPPRDDNPSYTDKLIVVESNKVSTPFKLSFRGVGGVEERKSLVHTRETFSVSRIHNGRDYTTQLRSQPIESSDQLLVVERWLHHIAYE